MRKQIEDFVQNCRTCAQCKHGPVPKMNVQDHRKVERLFEMISIDIAAMPLSLKGNQNFLLVTDNLSKLSTSIPVQDTQASTLISASWIHWFGHYGIPRWLQSDQGHNVDGQAIRKMCEELAIKKLRSSAYHPARNGSAERVIQSLKTIVRTICHSRGISIHQWDDVLPEASLHLNSMVNKSTKFSHFKKFTELRQTFQLTINLDVMPKEKHWIQY